MAADGQEEKQNGFAPEQNGRAVGSEASTSAKAQAELAKGEANVDFKGQYLEKPLFLLILNRYISTFSALLFTLCLKMYFLQPPPLLLSQDHNRMASSFSWYCWRR